ncbi:phosphotyrosine protein phosphatase [Bacteroidales bacterium]|nr:phosphotyrosine protein phosphatase [Bacteroidales bacterium]
MVLDKGLQNDFCIDSAGILGIHEGQLPDSRMRAHGKRRNYDLNSRSRAVVYQDFFDFDLIIGMDDNNIEALEQKAPDLESKKKIRRMSEYCSKHSCDHIPDPYYGGAQGFELVLDLLEDACQGLLESTKI